MKAPFLAVDNLVENYFENVYVPNSKFEEISQLLRCL